MRHRLDHPRQSDTTEQQSIDSLRMIARRHVYERYPSQIIVKIANLIRTWCHLTSNGICPPLTLSLERSQICKARGSHFHLRPQRHLGPAPRGFLPGLSNLGILV